MYEKLQGLVQLGLVLFVALVLPYSSVQASPPPVSSSVNVTATIPGTTGNLRLVGHASPNAFVTFLRSGIVTGTGSTDGAGFFDKTLTGIPPGVYTFSIYGSDTAGRTTLTLSFDTNVMSGTTITLSGFLLPPTVSLASAAIKRPQSQTLEGSAKSNATVTAIVSDYSKQVPTDSNGQWSAKVTETMHLGNQSAHALVQDSLGGQSSPTQSLNFLVLLSADLNVDDRVNLTDFSILMFNYGVPSSAIRAADINDNGPVDLVDFSVMMFHWTGG